MQTSESIKEISSSLIEFQSKVPVIFKSRSGFNYKYADLAEIKRVIQPYMSDCKLGCIQGVTSSGDEVAVTTMIVHASGEWIKDTVGASISGNRSKAMSLVQGQGSVITYLRRYGMSAMLGLVTDTDIDASVDSKTLRENEIKANLEEIKLLKTAIQDNMSVCSDENILNKFKVDCNKDLKNTSVEHWKKLKLASDVLPRESDNSQV